MSALDHDRHECTAECADEFATCVTEGPGFATCVGELRGAVPPLATVCPQPACVLTAAMAALNHTAAPATCSFACEREFHVCVHEGPGYAGCVQELAAGTAPLAGAGSPCAQGCSATATMTALGSGSGSGDAGGTQCPSACETEFLHCCAEGPGYTQCVAELRAAQGPLAATCPDPSCALTPAMQSQDPGSGTPPCTAACAGEFVTHCLPHHAPNGCSQCRAEINQQVGPLSQHCTPGCQDTPSMSSACAPPST